MTARGLRADALACVEAAIGAVDPERLVRLYLERAAASSWGDTGTIKLAAVGKAAAAMARGARAALGTRLTGGVIILPAGQESEAPPGFEVYGGGHPEPNEDGVAGAAALSRLATALGTDDHLLALVSGGGSALMTLPAAGLGLEDLQLTTRHLLRAGAAIAELNAVRKHLDEVKGGRLARAAAPATVQVLVLSDVVGDPLDVIASGPFAPDPTTFAEAVAILRRRGVWATIPAAVRDHLEGGQAGARAESPKEGDPCFQRVTTAVVGNNRLAALAALATAVDRGYRGLLLSTFLTGEAREVGCMLAAVAREVRASGQPIAPPACIVAAGETTVAVRGGGRGGRNQELVLGAAAVLDGCRGVLVASAGTDGVDGPTDAAGGWVTGDTLSRAHARGLSLRTTLSENDAYPFLDALGDLIRIGPTGTNVMDVQIVLVEA